MTTDCFYTYAYLREDKTPYYIGKGCGKRCFSSHRRVPVPAKERILILKKGLNEEEAWKHEKYMIFIFGRKDIGTGVLLNCTDGGEGSAGAVRSQEFKDNVSRFMSENHPMKGRPGPVTGLTLWTNIYTNEMVFQQTPPGEEWIKGRPQHLIEAHSGENNPNFGKKWWRSPDSSQEVYSFGPPSPSWAEGRATFAKQSRKKMSQRRKGGKWWVNQEGVTRYGPEKPEGEWKRGRKWS